MALNLRNTSYIANMYIYIYTILRVTQCKVLCGAPNLLTLHFLPSNYKILYDM
jgi:hypothetical protein